MTEKQYDRIGEFLNFLCNDSTGWEVPKGYIEDWLQERVSNDLDNNLPKELSTIHEVK